MFLQICWTLLNWTVVHYLIQQFQEYLVSRKWLCSEQLRMLMWLMTNRQFQSILRNNLLRADICDPWMQKGPSQSVTMDSQVFWLVWGVQYDECVLFHRHYSWWFSLAVVLTGPATRRWFVPEPCILRCPGDPHEGIAKFLPVVLLEHHFSSKTIVILPGLTDHYGQTSIVSNVSRLAVWGHAPVLQKLMTWLQTLCLSWLRQVFSLSWSVTGRLSTKKLINMFVSTSIWWSCWAGTLPGARDSVSAVTIQEPETVYRLLQCFPAVFSNS